MTSTVAGTPDRHLPADLAHAGVAARLAELRVLAASEPARAQNEAWDWVVALGTGREHLELQTLFALGTAPRQLDGPTEGAFLAPPPIRFGAVVGPLIAAVGRQVWTGKFFEHAGNTGGNLVTPLGRRILWLLRCGADFETYLGPGIPGSAPEVLLLDYSRGHRNGPLFGRILDEVVEILPDTYLLRGMWRRTTRDPVTLCYVVLRQPAAAR